MSEKLRLALLAGGKSGEREVSLKGAEEVYNALDHDKYEIKRYDPTVDLSRLAAEAEQIDVAFILLHGLFGEDGTMQGFLDLLDIPYQGSGVMGSAIAMDKNLSKILYQNAGLTVPDWVMVMPEDLDAPRIFSQLSLPVVLKPLRQGSSLGMSIVDSDKDFIANLEKAFSFDKDVMIEQYISGREITVGVLGNDELTALPLVEVIPGEEYNFFDYEAKYQPGATREICPADFPTEVTKKAQEFGLIAHKALHLRGYSRTDMIVDADNNIFVLETNTIPGMTPTSLLPQAANAYGLSFSALLDRLIELALEDRG